MTYIAKCIRLSEHQNEAIKELVEKGIYVTQSQAIRHAIREFLEKQKAMEKPPRNIVLSQS